MQAVEAPIHHTIIRINGRGLTLENIFVDWLLKSVKYKDIFLKSYATPAELHCGLKEYFLLFNVNRPSQSFGDSTPDKIYRTATGGGGQG